MFHPKSGYRELVDAVNGKLRQLLRIYCEKMKESAKKSRNNVLALSPTTRAFSAIVVQRLRHGRTAISLGKPLIRRITSAALHKPPQPLIG